MCVGRVVRRETIKNIIRSAFGFSSSLWGVNERSKVGKWHDRSLDARSTSLLHSHSEWGARQDKTSPWGCPQKSSYVGSTLLSTSSLLEEKSQVVHLLPTVSSHGSRFKNILLWFSAAPSLSNCHGSISSLTEEWGKRESRQWGSSQKIQHVGGLLLSSLVLLEKS